jgi:hypothetical protein
MPSPKRPRRAMPKPAQSAPDPDWTGKRRRDTYRVSRVAHWHSLAPPDTVTPGTVYPDDGLRRAEPDGGGAALARLARLEAGEPVVVAGWKVGMAQDSEPYALEGDGRVVPVEPVYADPDAPMRTVANYRRPDGSVVRPSESPLR